MDYYKTLGVERGASAAAIKSAYRRLARKLHPDVNSESGATERLKRVNEAYEVLSDDKKRSQYDRFGANWKNAQNMGGGGGKGAPWQGFGDVNFNLGDFIGGMGGMFGNMGGRGRGQSRRPAREMETEVTLTLQEAATGTERQIAVSSGGQQRKLVVKIPRGIADGGQVRINHPSGFRVMIKVRVQADARWQRRGDDLHAKVKVPLETAIFGGEVVVPTLTGQVALKIPPDTQNGRVFSLKQQGMPSQKSGKIGALLAEVVVTLPVPASAESKALYKQIFSNSGGGA